MGDFRNNKFIDESVVDENISPIGFFECKRDNKLENCHLNQVILFDLLFPQKCKTWISQFLFLVPNLQRNHVLCSRKIYEQGWAEPSKDVKKSSRNDEDSLPELERNKRIGNNDEERSPTQLVQIKGSIQWNSEATEDDGNSKKVTSLVSNGKEISGKGLADNGFVSTRKNRCRGENYFNKPQEFQLEGSKSRKTGTGMVLSTGEKNGGEKRKALSEKTNLQNIDVAGIAGKWRCPQKGKPDTGPPLKQLRLERWVHRL